MRGSTIFTGTGIFYLLNIGFTSVDNTNKKRGLSDLLQGTVEKSQPAPSIVKNLNYQCRFKKAMMSAGLPKFVLTVDEPMVARAYGQKNGIHRFQGNLPEFWWKRPWCARVPYKYKMRARYRWEIIQAAPINPPYQKPGQARQPLLRVAESKG